MTGQQADIQWYIARDGKQHGPLSEVEMRTFVSQGHLRPTDLIWRPGFADWRPAPAVFPFQAPEPPLPPVHVPATRPSTRAMAYAPEHSFEPSRIRLAQGMDDRAWRLVRRVITAGAVMLALLVVAGGGWYVWQSGIIRIGAPGTGDQAASNAPTPPTVSAPAAPVKTTLETLPSQAPPTQVSPEMVTQSAQALDAQFQQAPMWKLVKREFPDWYSEQLREAAKLSAGHQPRLEIAKHLAQALVDLRRKHADQALAASTEKLKQVANAFLGNLKNLSERSIGACYGFISQGETSPAVLEMMMSPSNDGAALQAQVSAIFEAIADGRKSPRSHQRAVKADYEVLVQQLTKLGWKENDLKVFSNPSALSREPPGRVCQMVQDWFVAHLSVQDKGAQERLLVETLKPVVSG